MSKRSPAERTLDAELFGRPIQFDYSETWLAYSMLGLRVVLAWVFLQAGLQKLASGGWTNPGGWSAESFLVHGVQEGNPFAPLMEFFAGYLWAVDPLVMWTQLLIGIALLFGVFFRLAALGGALQMLMFWIAAFQGGFGEGLPIAHGFVVDYTLVYAILLFGLGAWGAGRVLGVDAWLEDTEIVKNYPSLRYLLG